MLYSGVKGKIRASGQQVMGVSTEISYGIVWYFLPTMPEYDQNNMCIYIYIHIYRFFLRHRELASHSSECPGLACRWPERARLRRPKQRWELRQMNKVMLMYTHPEVDRIWVM